jgi:hypothetical protein
MFLRNVGSYKSHTASHPRRHHPSLEMCIERTWFDSSLGLLLLSYLFIVFLDFFRKMSRECFNSDDTASFLSPSQFAIQ